MTKLGPSGPRKVHTPDVTHQSQRAQEEKSRTQLDRKGPDCPPEGGQPGRTGPRMETPPTAALPQQVSSGHLPLRQEAGTGSWEQGRPCHTQSSLDDILLCWIKGLEGGGPMGHPESARAVGCDGEILGVDGAWERRCSVCLEPSLGAFLRRRGRGKRK